jgi:RHS repeat-associated protein
VTARHPGDLTIVNRAGVETMKLVGNGAEESQTVREHLGVRVWQWRIKAPGLQAQVSVDGAVVFSRRGRPTGLGVAPPKVYGPGGSVVTPQNVRWSLSGRRGAWVLGLLLHDARLPIPYTIDPVLGEWAAPLAATSVIGAPDFTNSTQFAVDFRLSNPLGTALDPVHHRLFVDDSGDDRVLVYQLSDTNHRLDKTPSFVIGEPDFSTENGGSGAALIGDDTQGLAYDAVHDRLFVSDRFNNRVLVFDLSGGITNGMDASHVLGQPDMTHVGSSSASQTSLDDPMGLALDASSGLLYVADHGNSRVMVFDVAPGSISDDEDASYVLGEPDFTSVDPGENADQLNGPSTIAVDPENQLLFVGDSQNLVLIYDTSALSNGMDADHVLGASAFGTAGAGGVGANTFSSSGLAYDSAHQRLFVDDSPDNRMLIFDLSQPITNGEDAVGVIGQTNFDAGGDDGSCAEIHAIASQTTLCGPSSGDDAYDTASNTLYSSDSGYRRVLLFNVPLGIEKLKPETTYAGYDPAVPGAMNCKQLCGDPVNPATGDFSETTTDASVGTFGPALAFTRTYDSSMAQAEAASSSPGQLGYGWTDNWDASLTLQDDGSITVNQSDGAQVTFYPPVDGSCPSPYVGSGASGTYCAPADVTASLSYDSSSATYTFITHPYQRYTFNSTGQLTGLSEPGGAATTVAYNTPAPGVGACPATANSCEKITSASGRALVIGLNSSNEITTVTDPHGVSLGRSWTYTYCSPPSSTCSSGDLIKVTNLRGKSTTFTYDEGNSDSSLTHDLLKVTRPNGQSGGPDAGDALFNTYNASGEVTSQTDPAGNATELDYSNLDSDSGDGYTIETDPDGNETQYVFDGSVLISLVNGYGASSPATESFQPDPNTLLNSASFDPNGNTTAESYDADGNAITTTNPLGDTASAAYNNYDEAVCTTTALAAAGCPSLSPPAAISGGGTITPPSSAPPAYATYNEYDTAGNLIWTTTGDYGPGDDTAAQSRTSYDVYTGESVTLGSTNHSCATTPPASSLPCLAIDPNGVVTKLGYASGTGDLTSTSTPDGNSGGEVAKTTYTYNNEGQTTSVVAPKGNLSGATPADFKTTYTYTNDELLMTMTVGRTTGSVTARTTSYCYDPDGNRTAVVAPNGNTSGTAACSMSTYRVTATPQANYQTIYQYDADDQLTLVTDPDSQKTLTCYDGDGNLTETVPATGVAANSLTAASCPTSYPSGYGDRLASDATTYSYDALGNRSTVTTPAPAGQSGHETSTYSYDPAGQLMSVSTPPASDDTGAPDQVTEYNYDDAGETTSVTTASGTSAAATTTYCYDPAGEKTATVPPDGEGTCSSSPPYQTSSSYQTGYEYDSLGELVSKSTPSTSFVTDPTSTSGYDPAGNRVNSESPGGVTTSYTYTPRNQLATVSYSDSTPSVAYTYDANGNRTSMVDGTGTSSYSYDPFDQLTSYENGAGKTVQYGYDPDGNTTAITYPLGSPSWASSDTVSYGYDNADELNSIGDLNGHSISIGNTADRKPSSISFASTGDTIDTTYDATGSPADIKLKAGTSTLQEFSYSGAPAGTIGSETDTPSSSLSPASYTYDAQSRVTQMTPGAGSALTYSFDPSGNLTTLPTGATASYDEASELTSSSLSGITTSYTYSEDGERTLETVGGSTTMSATYNGAQELTSYANGAADMTAASYDGDGLRQSATSTPSGGASTTQHFTWDVSGSLPRLLMDSTNAYIYGPSHTPIEQVNLSSGAVQYLVADSLGSVRGIVTSTGTLTATTTYDAWGNPETTSGLTSYTSFGYGGYFTDPTGLTYNIARYYDPTSGQFLTVDPMVDMTDQPYAYVAGDPVNLLDPSGLHLCWNPTSLNCWTSDIAIVASASAAVVALVPGLEVEAEGLAIIALAADIVSCITSECNYASLLIDAVAIVPGVAAIYWANQVEGVLIVEKMLVGVQDYEPSLANVSYFENFEIYVEKTYDADAAAQAAAAGRASALASGESTGLDAGAGGGNSPPSLSSRSKSGSMGQVSCPLP